MHDHCAPQMVVCACGTWSDGDIGPGLDPGLKQ